LFLAGLYDAVTNREIFISLSVYRIKFSLHLNEAGWQNNTYLQKVALALCAVYVVFRNASYGILNIHNCPFFRI
jgi:hypothetical protein